MKYPPSGAAPSRRTRFGERFRHITHGINTPRAKGNRATKTDYVHISAKVVAGKGTLGTKAPETGLQRHRVFELTGIQKVPGSLNIRTTNERVWMRKRNGLRWSGGRMYRGRIEGIDVAFTKRGGFAASPHLYHVYSDVHLRSVLGLEDGDVVRFEVLRSDLARAPLLHEAVYLLRLTRLRILGRQA